MDNSTNEKEMIIELLQEKACNKQTVYKQTFNSFNRLKKGLKQTGDTLSKQMQKVDKGIKISYENKDKFECSLTFGGDILMFTMHTNVFTFDANHFIHKSSYIQENNDRAYCGIIQIYNFLADSFKYDRENDLGYLIGRIFINKEKHFFVEGKRQLGFLYNDIENLVLDDDKIKAIIESAIIYCINFDLLSPPYQSVQEITVAEKIKQSGILTIKTGKRLGFRFQADNDRIE